MKKAAVVCMMWLSAFSAVRAQTPSPAPSSPAPASPSPASPNPAAPPAQPIPPGAENSQLTPGLRDPRRPLVGVSSNLMANPSATNQSFFTNQNALAIQDRAVTSTDQTLLITLRRTVETTLQIKASPWMPVHFDINNGVVTLFGTIETANQKQQVVTTVQQTPGVARVIDQLVVGSTEQVSTTQDQSLLLRVRQTVLPQIQVAGVPPPINFSIQQGLVTITGTVPTIEQKRQILALVQQVPGVVQVSDQTVVSPSAGAVGTPNLTPTGR
jgi:BON domain-containing protein